MINRGVNFFLFVMRYGNLITVYNWFDPAATITYELTNVITYHSWLSQHMD